MRCLAFADGLSRHKSISRFLIKSFEPQVADLIRAHGFSVDEIASDSSVEEDVHLTRATSLKHHASLIVTDLCTRPAVANRYDLDRYHYLLSRGLTVLGLAGGEFLDLPATIVVYPYIRTNFSGRKADSACLQLVGPEYYIFRREFIEAAGALRIIKTRAQRVLVTIGGGDAFYLSAKVIAAISKLSLPGLSLRVVIGPAYSESLKRQIRSLHAGFSGEYEILDHNTNMADAMLWADLAITGDGLTKYEAAVTGTPVLILSRPDSEPRINDEFERAGSSRHLGDGTVISTDALTDSIAQLLGDYGTRQAMSHRGQAMVDGNGLERILAAISGIISE